MTTAHPTRTKSRPTCTKASYLLLLIPLVGCFSSCVSPQQRIVDRIITTQEQNTTMLPPSVQGVTVASLDDAYSIQRRYDRSKSKTHGPVSGYKIAYASKQSQQSNGIPEPVYGSLFAKQQVPNNGTLAIAEFTGFHIESEVAVIIDRDVPMSVTSIAGLKPYIRSVHLGYDIPDNIFDVSKGKPVPNDIVIFGAGAHTYCLGPAHSLQNIRFSGNDLDVFHGRKKVYQGNEKNTMGSPMHSLLWLHQKLQSQGKGLKANQVILCGAVAGAYKIKGEAAKGVYSAHHPLLGKVTIQVK